MANELVTFREDGLRQFIKLIKTNPNMIKNITMATDQDIKDWNDLPVNNHPTDWTPVLGKGLKVIFADDIDGSHTIIVPVGSDVKVSQDDGSLTVDGVPVGKFIPGEIDIAGNNKLKRWVVKDIAKNNKGVPYDLSLQAVKVYGAVFNDYAEYRIADADFGRCVIETGKGNLIKSTDRLQLGANIVSDTYGFSIGETETAKTPIAVCGRVLAYPFEDINLYTPGAAVCSGPNGTVSLMTREEIKEWPDAIVGYVSEIPSYDTWGSDNVPVNGRIWIKIK